MSERVDNTRQLLTRRDDVMRSHTVCRASVLQYEVLASLSLFVLQYIE